MPKLTDGCKFELHTLDNVYSNVPVINKNCIDYYFWFKLPDTLKNANLIQIDCISDNYFDVCFKYSVARKNKLWLKAIYSFLKLEIGQHTYKFSFMNPDTEDIESYYFSYIIQSNDPEKPYIYMHKKGK